MGFFQSLGKNLKHLVGAGGIDLKISYSSPLTIFTTKTPYIGSLTVISKENAIMESLNYRIEMVTKEKDAQGVTQENKEVLGETKTDLQNKTIAAGTPQSWPINVGTEFYNVKTTAEQDFGGKGGVMGAIAGLSKMMSKKEVHYYLIVGLKLQGIAFPEENKVELVFQEPTYQPQAAMPTTPVQQPVVPVVQVAQPVEQALPIQQPIAVATQQPSADLPPLPSQQPMNTDLPAMSTTASEQIIAGPTEPTAPVVSQ